ncbi:MAG: protein adenylyltransferase SelO family protein, partial [Waterburya sp.]
EVSSLEIGLAQFDDYYQQHYQQLMLQKLGFASDLGIISQELLAQTISLLRDTEISYHGFFAELAQEFDCCWVKDQDLILANASFAADITDSWRRTYHQCLNHIASEDAKQIEQIGDRLKKSNPQTALLRPVIESVWRSISEENVWQAFTNLLERLGN